MVRATLNILGSPVTFTTGDPSRITACKSQGKLPDGTWPRGRCKGQKATTAVKKAAKTAVKPKAAPKPAAAPAPAADAGELASLPRLPRPEAAQTAAKNTNPLNGRTSFYETPTYPAQGKQGKPWTPALGPLPHGAFEENCTNVVMAWDMRMRGYDVNAAPLTELDKSGYASGRTFKGLDELLASAYTLPGGKPHGRSFFGGDPRPPWQSFKQIDAQVESWPDGARGVITTGRHIFNVIKTGGKARYIEAQMDGEVPSRNVTRAYKTRFKAGTMFGGEPEEGKVMRIDDLEPAAGVMVTLSTPGQTQAWKGHIK